MVRGQEGQHPSLRARRNESSFSPPASTGIPQHPASCSLAVGPRAGGPCLSLPVCETGEALGEEGGWEASGNRREVQTVCTPEPTVVTTLFVLSTLQSSIPCCLRPRHPELRPHPTIPTAVLCLGASPRLSSSHQGTSVPDGQPSYPTAAAQGADNSLQAWLLPYYPAKPTSSPPFPHPQPAVISHPLPKPPSTQGV